MVRSYTEWCEVEEVEAVFTGTYCHNTDAKGRIIMPSRFRDQIGDKFVITCGYEGCLTIYPTDEWEKFAQKLLSMPDHNADARRLLRMFSSVAVDCEADKQGRFLLPARLREYAGIEKEVMIIGAISKIEVWDSAKWEEYNSNKEALTLEEAAANLSKFGS